jgi:DNA-binding LacI/PurR family transcriptional regulator
MQRIGVITNNRQGVFQRLILEGFGGTAAKRGYDLLVDSLNENPDRAVRLDPARVDGLLVIANAVPDDFMRDVYRRGIPLSLVSYQVPDTPIPVVMSNNAQGMAQLVAHVVKRCGRRRLVFIRGILGQSDGRQREAAFRHELLRYNLDVPEEFFLHGEFTPDVAAASVRELIQRGASFDAIIAADYLMAIAAVDELRAAGLDVPGDVSVVGFGDAPEARQAGLTTVGADIRELGKRSAYQLISQIEGLHIRGMTVLSVELVIRQTCGCGDEG